MEQLNAKQFIESNYCTLRLFILISFGFLIIPAYSQSIKSLSDIKWKKSLTNIKSKMANNGYYKRNTMPEAFIFYDDGTLVFCNSIPNDTVSYRGGSFPPGGYYDQETKRWESGSSGVYKIEGDTGCFTRRPLLRITEFDSINTFCRNLAWGGELNVYLFLS